MTAPPAPDLRSADVILVCSSAGKDSQVMLDHVAEQAQAAGVPDRLVILHNDLGDVEWPGTEALAKRQAELYGARFAMRHRTQGLLLEQISERNSKLRARGDTTTPAWPSSAARYCTSDQKRGPGRKFITELVSELGLNRQAKVLYCMGLRAAESPGRAKKACLHVDATASSKVREVTTWLPILTWTDRQVWQRIATQRLPYHWAYDAGMERLSCSFCVLASRSDCVTAARLRPDLAQRYLQLEREVGHAFRKDFSIHDVITEAARLGPITWFPGDALRRHLGNKTATKYLTNTRPDPVLVNTTPNQDQPTPAALPYLRTDPAFYSAVLAEDGYGWLARILPAPAALPCPRCQVPMRLGAVPLLWECTDCDPRDTAGHAA